MSAFISLVGQTFTRLTVVKHNGFTNRRDYAQTSA